MNLFSVRLIRPQNQPLNGYLASQNFFVWLEAFSSCGIEGNRLAEICAETLQRLLAGKPVGDRYVLGLAWTMVQETLEKNVS